MPAERVHTTDADYYALGVEPPRPWYRRRSVISCAAGALILSACGLVVFFRGSWVGAEANATSSPETAPAPAPQAGAGKPARLRITNGCKSDSLWIANFAFQAPHFPQDLELAAGKTHAFDIPDEGLVATRFWAKWGCDKTGNECKIGQSGGPGESCPKEGCAPPIDSKFEATFGCTLSDTSKCATNPSSPDPAHPDPVGPIDWWDVSQVDGWTLPYKVEIIGDCPAVSSKVIDCSHLSLDECPAKEDLGLKSGPETLQLVDGKALVGCYSPCAKLTYSQRGQGHAFTPESKEAQDYCCPTPPITPDVCSAGPVIKTDFVKAVHKLCPGVYAYAYDDGMGLAQCPAGVVYDVTFYCPAAGA